jgi:transcriptional regulator
MFIPRSFREQRTEVLHELLRTHPLGLLISQGATGLQFSPLPFLLYADEGEQGVLRAHLARANPHWKEFEQQAQCWLIFQAENGYVSPSWYPSKAETGRAVPTWNYRMVEVRGTVSIQEDPAWLRRQLADLTDYHEGIRLQPWALADAPDDYLASQLRAIVGLEIAIEQLEGKWKMSQNKSAADQLGVIQGLRDELDPHRNPALAEQIEALLPDESL